MIMFLLGTLFGAYFSVSIVFFYLQRIFGVNEGNSYAVLRALVWPYYVLLLLFGNDEDVDITESP